MGVYLKDLKVPENCDVCPIFLAFTTCGLDRDHCMFQDVHEPHGRLIDADALMEDLKRQCEEVFKINAVSPDDFWITRDHAYNERLWKTWCESFFEYLKERDTVIPASEELPKMCG